MSQNTPRILHLHATFDAGPKEMRCVRLINQWGGEAQHAIVSNDLARRGAAHAISPKVKISWPKFPPLAGRPTPGRLKTIAAAMAGYDLICTYDWGAIDAVMAHTLFADVHALPPLVHHEDDLGDQEAVRLKTGRTWYRRIALGRTAALVVPSKRLERIALEVWQQPRARVQRIASGIDTRNYSAPAARDILPGLIKRKGEYWLGAVAALQEEANLDILVRAMRRLPPDWQLVILGDGPERQNLLDLAVEKGVEDRVHLPGSIARHEKLIGLFDIFALPSGTENFPLAVVEAMAAGLPVVAPRTGDVAEMLSTDNGPLLSVPDNRDALHDILFDITGRPQDRKRIGHANRDKARAEYDALRMTERYRSLYWGLMDRNRTS
jgi:glycosyltransferase involved in cell wall biosynthesis